VRRDCSKEHGSRSSPESKHSAVLASCTLFAENRIGRRAHLSKSGLALLRCHSKRYGNIRRKRHGRGITATEYSNFGARTLCVLRSTMNVHHALGRQDRTRSTSTTSVTRPKTLASEKQSRSSQRFCCGVRNRITTLAGPTLHGKISSIPFATTTLPFLSCFLLLLLITRAVSLLFPLRQFILVYLRYYYS
jgi:hypothetical protein